MRCWLVLIVAAIVVAYQMQETEAKFSFSLPGKWGGAKRGGSFSFSLPGKWGGQGKRSGDALGACGELDPETMYYLYSLIQSEGARISECLAGKLDNEATEKQ